MKDNWLDDLHKKMEGHTESAPEGLWNDLEQKLFSEKEEARMIPLFSEEKSRTVKHIWFSGNGRKTKRALAVAAVVVFMVTGGILFQYGHLSGDYQQRSVSQQENRILNTPENKPLPSRKDQVFLPAPRQENTPEKGLQEQPVKAKKLADFQAKIQYPNSTGKLISRVEHTPDVRITSGTESASVYVEGVIMDHPDGSIKLFPIAGIKPDLSSPALGSVMEELYARDEKMPPPETRSLGPPVLSAFFLRVFVRTDFPYY
ncbi:MAG: hypothetical protein LRY55_07610 [Leadbetterella sp.]|nr:hypothetical protein [Leadbetterella sp.]